MKANRNQLLKLLLCLFTINLLIMQTLQSCPPGQINIGGICKRVCPNRFYLNPSTYLCVSCGDGCDSCDDGNACLTCDNDKKKNLVNNKCVTSCPNGTTENPGNGAECISCTDTNCKNCSGDKDTCTECNSPNYLQALTPTCSSSCEAAYWPNKKTLTCDACPANCSACPTNGKICTACIATFKLFDEDCVATCPDRTFEEESSGKQVCTLCEGKCAECSSNSVCTRCSKGYFLKDSDCVIDCNANQNLSLNERGFFYDYSVANSAKCTQCGLDCKTCSSATNCSVCFTNLLIQNGNCVSECSSGYYPSGNNCLPCLESNCSSCPSNLCETCNSGYALKDNNCYQVGSCPTGFYAGPDPMNSFITKCLACNNKCATCTWRESNNCSSCKFGFFLDGTTCYSTCPNGKYGDLTDSLCKICGQSECSTCTSADICTSCAASFFLLNSRCVSECGEGYKENSTTGICDSCNVNKCKDCDADITKCTTCFDGYLLLGDNQCVQPCPTGFYLDENNDCVACDTTSGNPWCKPPCADGNYPDFSKNECETCKDECSKCTSATVCTECKASNYFIADKNDCVTTCPTGYLNDDTTSPISCKKCDTGCVECSTTYDNCTRCEKDFYYVPPHVGQPLGKCYEVCLDGSYFDRGTYTCTDCLSNCKECDSTAICYECKNNFFLQSNATECKDSCPFGSFVNTTSRKCESCESNCLVCFDSTTCIVCNSPFNLNNGDCVSQCPQGKFAEAGVCKDCSTDCLVCTDAATCTTCGNDKFLSDNKCVTTCPDNFYGNTTTMACAACGTDCKTCNNSEVCTVCTNSKVLFFDHTCITSCGDEFYAENGVCKQCNSSCQTCTDAATCQSCNENFFLEGTTCGATCPGGKYAASEDNTCKACNASCSKCTGSKTCSECVSGKYLLNNSCLDTCPSGYYGDSNECKLCSTPLANCKTCTNATTCTACNINFYLTDVNTCVDNCADGYFENVANGICTACDSNCLTCSDVATRCDSCVGWKLLFNYGCVNPCPEASAFLNPSKMCQNCSPACIAGQVCSPTYNNVFDTTWDSACQSIGP